MLLDVMCALVLGAFGTLAVVRMAFGVRATRIAPVSDPVRPGSLTVIVPVLDEAARIEPCLRGLLASGPEVAEILIVDGGSRDNTVALVRDITAADARVRIIDAAPVPADWNGKAWGLDVGRRATHPATRWIATIDADVRPAAGLFAAMIAHAQRRHVDALSVATRQIVAGPLTALIHPAMLATLVYRFGLPGREATHVSDVQANGQCFLATRALLEAHGAFGIVRASRCEDVTLARSLVASGTPVGFYEAGDLVSVQMHSGWRDAWLNWPRSLTLRDEYARFGGWFGLTEIALAQALPIPLAIVLALLHQTTNALFVVAAVLAIVRIGVLCGAARAYVDRPWTYWLSPLADVPVLGAMIVAALRKRHTWRGRELVLAEKRA